MENNKEFIINYNEIDNVMSFLRTAKSITIENDGNYNIDGIIINKNFFIETINRFSEYINVVTTSILLATEPQPEKIEEPNIIPLSLEETLKNIESSDK
jgi:nitrogenase subunit NifH